jgi:hypothetical protein
MIACFGKEFLLALLELLVLFFINSQNPFENAFSRKHAYQSYHRLVMIKQSAYDDGF